MLRTSAQGFDLVFNISRTQLPCPSRSLVLVEEAASMGEIVGAVAVVAGSLRGCAPGPHTVPYTPTPSIHGRTYSARALEAARFTLRVSLVDALAPHRLPYAVGHTSIGLNDVKTLDDVEFSEWISWRTVLQGHDVILHDTEWSVSALSSVAEMNMHQYSSAFPQFYLTSPDRCPLP
mmetsp:Transcript_6918/g.15335  ORF Transcript_6918/g.15335 Transcript_6918/m.15335 type:complete len:177 (+) Transcript_6918:94-624(+)